MNVEVLYFEGCPNHHPAVERVQGVLREEGISSQVIEVAVPDTETAKRLRFIGSPSIRVNGVDIEPSALEVTSFGLLCRTYQDGCCRTGVPATELIREAVRLQPARRQRA